MNINLMKKNMKNPVMKWNNPVMKYENYGSPTKCS